MASYVAMQQIARGFLKWSPVVTSFKTSRHGNDVQDSDAIEVLVPMEVGKQQDTNVVKKWDTTKKWRDYTRIILWLYYDVNYELYYELYYDYTMIILWLYYIYTMIYTMNFTMM